MHDDDDDDTGDDGEGSLHSTNHSYGTWYTYRFGLLRDAHLFAPGERTHCVVGKRMVEYLLLAFFFSLFFSFPFFSSFFFTQARYYFLPAKLSRGSRWRDDEALPRSSSRAREEKRKNNGRPRERNSNCDPRTIDTRASRTCVRVCINAWTCVRVCECARVSLIDRVDSRASGAQIILRSSVGCTFFGGSRNCRQ